MREYISLAQLLQGIKGAVAETFPGPVWVKAEIHELRIHGNGHCYMELVEKGSGRDVFSAKVSAVIWRSRRALVEAAFYQGTGRRLEAGMTVLVRVRVQYSELYGMSLSIEDIDPAFTLGEVELARQRTLERLTREGLLEVNKSLPMPGLPRRFALITSETAAGYGDFMNHLYDNGYGFRFYTRLYPAPMQGATAPAGIMDALNSVLDDLAEGAQYDAVLLLRGGGAVADLVCFDDYDLAVSIARFPLPVLVAVGHERGGQVSQDPDCPGRLHSGCFRGGGRFPDGSGRPSAFVGHAQDGESAPASGADGPPAPVRNGHAVPSGVQPDGRAAHAHQERCDGAFRQ